MNCLFQPVNTSVSPNVHDSPANVLTSGFPSTISWAALPMYLFVSWRMYAAVSAELQSLLPLIALRPEGYPGQ